MKYQTRDFGAVELDESQIIEFVRPVFGFEKYHKFTVLCDETIGTRITWLQSLEEPGLCFILADPDAISADYAPILPPETERLLGAGEYACWAIAVIRENGKSTANLKSPILINMESGRGMQVILDQEYPVRFPLVGEAQPQEC